MRCAHPHAGAHPHGDYLDSTRLTTTRSRSAMSTADVTTTPVITLTDNAAAKVAELIAQESDDLLTLRVAVRPGGCSGFSYEMFFDAESDPEDHQAVFGTVKVRVDPASAQRSCGCGQSFA